MAMKIFYTVTVSCICCISELPVRLRGLGTLIGTQTSDACVKHALDGIQRDCVSNNDTIKLCDLVSI